MALLMASYYTKKSLQSTLSLSAQKIQRDLMISKFLLSAILFIVLLECLSDMERIKSYFELILGTIE